MKPALANITSEQARLELDALMQEGRQIKKLQNEWNLRAGRLLCVVKEHRFYKDWGFSSLESYMETTYGVARSTGYEWMDYSEVIASLPEKVSGAPDTSVSQQTTSDVIGVAHARILKNVPEEDRAEVLADAAASPRGVTTDSLKASAARAASAEKQVNEPPKLRDHTGWAIPASVLPLWHRQQAVKDMLKSLGSLRGTIRRVMEAGNDPLFRECDVHAMLTHCDNLHAQLKLAVPYAVCPYCHGVTMKECQSCKGRGVMSQFRWDHIVIEEMKAMRKLALEDERKADK